MEILATSSINPYLKILYPRMGPPTTPGPPPSKSGAGVGTGKFLGVRRIFAQTCPKRFCASFAYKFSRTRSWRPFLCDLQKMVFLCSSANVGWHFLRQIRLGAICARIFHRFSGILPNISGNLPRSSGSFAQIFGILPGFLTNQNFWGCACNPSSCTTDLGYSNSTAVGRLYVLFTFQQLHFKGALILFQILSCSSGYIKELILRKKSLVIKKTVSFERFVYIDYCFPAERYLRLPRWWNEFDTRLGHAEDSKSVHAVVSASCLTSMSGCEGKFYDRGIRTIPHCI